MKKSSSSKNNLPPIITLILFNFVFFYKIILNPGLMGPGGDIERYHYFVRTFLSKCSLAGNFPHWNPYIMSGMPFHATMEGGVLYPSHLLYLILPVITALNVDFILHFILTSVFMFYLLREMKLGRWESVCGAMIWCFGSVTFAQFSLGHLAHMQAYTWLPIIFLLTKRFLETGLVQYIGILAMCSALQFLAGHPQYWIYTNLTVGFFSLWWLINSHRNKSLSKYNIIRPIYLLIGLVLGLIIALPQLLPAFELARNSVTSIPEGSGNYSFVGSMPVKMLLNIVFPSLFGNPAFGVNFSGTASFNHAEFLSFSGVIAILLLMHSSKRIKTLPYGYFFPVLGVLSLLFALGNNTPIYPLFLKIVPLPSEMRMPVRFLILVSFSISIMAAFGLKNISEFKNSKINLRWFKFFLYIALPLSLAIIVFRENIWSVLETPLSEIIRNSGLLNDNSSYATMVGKFITYITINSWDVFRSALVLLAALWTISKFQDDKITNKVFVMSFAAIIFIELFTYTQPFIKPVVFERDRTAKKVAAIIKNVDPDSGNEPFRVISFHKDMPQEENLSAGLYGTDGFEAFILKNYADFLYNTNRLNGHDIELHANSHFKIKPGVHLAEALKPLNVKYAITENPIQFDRQWNMEHWKEIHAESGLYIYRNLLQPTYVSFIPDEMSGPVDFSYELPGNDYNYSEIKVNSSTPGTVLISEIDYPAWRLLVNGEIVDKKQRGELFRSFKIDSGESVLEMEYKDKSFMTGIKFSLKAFLLSLILIIAGVLKTKKQYEPNV